MLLLSFRSSHHEMDPTGSLEMIPENCPLDPAGRLSISLDTEGCISSPSSMGSPHQRSPELRCNTLDPRRARQTNPSLLTDPRGETKSFACLPQVIKYCLLQYKKTSLDRHSSSTRHFGRNHHVVLVVLVVKLSKFQPKIQF